jgi:hypothetical protein
MSGISSRLKTLSTTFLPWFFRYGVFFGLGVAMLIGVAVGSRYEREFRTSLEQGFQQRVELGDLASSVQQLRRILEAPRALDPGFIGGMVERIKEVEAKSKAQVDAGRVSDLSLPTKELAAIVSMQQGFERLGASTSQLERAHNLKLTLKPAEAADLPALKRVSGAMDAYVEAANALRNARSSAAALPTLRDASMALGEYLPAATVESRRKNAPAAWRDILALLPAERGDLVDRLLADGRMLDELQAQRGRAMSRLEQMAAKIDSAERMLLQSRSGGGLLVVAAILTWGGVGMGLLGLLYAAFRRPSGTLAEGTRETGEVELMVPRSVLASEHQHEHGASRDGADTATFESESRRAESMVSAQLANVIAGRDATDLPMAQAALLSESGQSSQMPTVRQIAEVAMSESIETLSSGYWIEAGSMAERRVALLDRQSDQLERHVKAVMAAAETLAGRIDMVVQSLQLALEHTANAELHGIEQIKQRVEELQSLALNLSLQVTGGESAGPVLDDLERFNAELESLTGALKYFGEPMGEDAAASRRISNSLDEGRRMIAAAETLKERTETLFEDAQRFRRHSESLIRGIQEGAVADLPASYIRGRSPTT